jgi:protein ImuA
MKNPSALEQLLRRGDVWRGHSHAFIAQETWHTGFSDLDKALLNSGWPKQKLIECCCHYHTFTGEWLLFGPVLKNLCAHNADAYVMLLNPPALPFAPALIQLGLPLNQLLVVESHNKQEFLSGFLELTRSTHCVALLAWQQGFNLNYSELRKCQLACAEGAALYVLLRPPQAQTQSSPAPLRISLAYVHEALQLDIFKQRGLFHKRSVQIAVSHAETSSHELAAKHKKHRAQQTQSGP